MAIAFYVGQIEGAKESYVVAKLVLDVHVINCWFRGTNFKPDNFYKEDFISALSENLKVSTSDIFIDDTGIQHSFLHNFVVYDPDTAVVLNRIPLPSKTWNFEPTAFNYSEGNILTWWPHTGYATLLANATSGIITITQSSSFQNSNDFWMYCRSCLPFLQSGINYSVSVDIMQSQSNGLFPNNILQLNLAVLKRSGAPWAPNFTELITSDVPTVRTQLFYFFHF